MKQPIFSNKFPYLIVKKIVNEVDDILQSNYYHFLLVYGNVDWFVEEVKKLGSKMKFHYCKNTKKDIIMTQEDEENYINEKIVDFVKKLLSLMMLHKGKIISIHLYFKNLVTLIVINSSRIWLI